MEKINLPQASGLTSPNPVTLVCTKKPDGSTNLATVSWWTYISFNPEMVAYAMAKTSYSGERVRENKEVIITVPGAALADEVMACGTSTGRDTDKVAKNGIEMAELPDSEIRIPAESKVAIKCTLKEFHEVGDHYLYICDVDSVYADKEKEALFAWNGYAEVAPARK